MVTYSAWAGQLIEDGVVLLGVVLVPALLLPLLIGWKLKVVGPRFLAAFNLLPLGCLLFFAGPGTDEYLALNGRRIFEPLGDSPAVTGTASLTVDVLRYAARRGADAPIDEATTDGGWALPQDGGTATIPAPGAPDGGIIADGGSALVPPAQDGGSPIAVVEPAADGGLISPDPDPPAPTGDPEVLVIPINPGGGTFDVGAMVNRKVPTSFVFDSGAHDVSITSALARRLGLDESDAIEWRTYLTANGKVRQPVVIIESIDLGEGFEVEDVEGSICQGCSDNLLGRSFQKHFLIEIDSANAEVRLRRNR